MRQTLESEVKAPIDRILMNSLSAWSSRNLVRPLKRRMRIQMLERVALE